MIWIPWWPNHIQILKLRICYSFWYRCRFHRWAVEGINPSPRPAPLLCGLCLSHLRFEPGATTSTPFGFPKWRVQNGGNMSLALHQDVYLCIYACKYIYIDTYTDVYIIIKSFMRLLYLRYSDFDPHPLFWYFYRYVDTFICPMIIMIFRHYFFMIYHRCFSRYIYIYIYVYTYIHTYIYIYIKTLFSGYI